MTYKKKQDTPELVIPAGYDILDLLDTDDEGYELGNPMKKEEVDIRYE